MNYLEKGIETIIAKLLKETKLCLDKDGIEVPFPRMAMYSRQEREGLIKRKLERNRRKLKWKKKSLL